MRRLVVIVGLMLAVVGCSAPPAQGVPGSESPAAPTRAYDDGY